MEPIQSSSKMANSEEIQDRIDIIVDKLLLKWRRSEICKTYSVEWNLSYRQIDDYIKWAKEEIQKYSIPATPELIKERIQEYEKLYRLSLSQSQYAVSKSILKDISELQGLLLQKLDITSAGEKLPMYQIQIIYPEKNEE